MIATLQIETVWKNTSLLRHVFYTPPFKVANITEDFSADTLQLMMMNSSPGVLDGDDYRIAIKIGRESSLRLHTQSYQRLFTMKKNAFQSINIHLEKNASFVFIQHPTVPHVHSNFITENNIYLSDGCELLWSDIITCGRKGCGEFFSFTKYHSLTKIFYNKKLVVKENLLMEPANVSLQLTGQWESYSHQASLFYWNEKMAMPLLIVALHDLMKDAPDLSLGISKLPVNGLIIRMLGNSAEQLFELFNRVATFIYQQKLLNRPIKGDAKTVAHAG